MPRKATVDRAFGDLMELDHVCEIIRESEEDLYIESISLSEWKELFCPRYRYIVSRLERQEESHSNIVDQRKPGLWIKTYIHFYFIETYDLFEKIEDDPSVLPIVIDRLELLLHKLYICGMAESEGLELMAVRYGQDGAQKRHQKNIGLRIKSVEMFRSMEKGRPWNSLSEAASHMSGSFPELRESNAVRTLCGWLTVHLKKHPEDLVYLEEKAQKRLTQYTSRG